jgi:hypothetical protein
VRERWVGEFDRAEDAVEALRRLQAAGAVDLDVLGPRELPGAAEALGLGRPPVPWWGLAGALAGGLGGWGLQWWVSVVAWPLDVGGRPLYSWPAYVPLAFEGAVLCGALAVVVGFLWVTGLPRPHDPLDAADVVARASVDRFVVAARGDRLDGPLREAGALSVTRLP